MGFIQNAIAFAWNALLRRRARSGGLRLGLQVRDGLIGRKQIRLPQRIRQQHIAIIGKTGAGKSSLLRHFMAQDIRVGSGFVCIDLHGDLIPFVLATITKEEQRTGPDLDLHGVYYRNYVYQNIAGWDSFEPTLSRLEQMNLSALQMIASEIPDEWYQHDCEGLSHLIATLHNRRPLVRQLITNFRNSSRNPFPAWKT